MSGKKDQKDAKGASAAAPASNAPVVTNTGSHAPAPINGVVEPSVAAILLLDSEGGRLAAKYYTKDVSLSDLKSQLLFERKVFEKTAKANARQDADILSFDSLLCIYKFRADVNMYVFIPSEENELVGLATLNAVDESITDLLRKSDGTGSVNKKSVLENLDLVFLAIDEIVDDGTLLETDSFEVVNRVSMASAVKEIPLSEQSFSQVVNSAKNQLIQSFS